jgi:hypothetical protein
MLGWRASRCRLRAVDLDVLQSKMAEIHLFQTKSHTRRSLSQSRVAMWRSKRVQCYHVAMRELLLSCEGLARDKLGTRNGAMEEFRLGFLI